MKNWKVSQIQLKIVSNNIKISKELKELREEDWKKMKLENLVIDKLQTLQERYFVHIHTVISSNRDMLHLHPRIRDLLQGLLHHQLLLTILIPQSQILLQCKLLLSLQHHQLLHHLL